MDRTRLAISASVAFLIFVCVVGITSNVMISMLLAVIAVVLIQVQGILSDRATKQRAIDREARREAMLSAASEKK